VSPSSTHTSPDAPGGNGLQLTIVCAASFVVWAGFGAVLPYLPVFLREEANASVRLIGVIAAAYYVGTFLFSSRLGALSDRVGRKPVIVAGVWIYALSTALFVTTTSPFWFVLFRFVEGIGAAAVGPAGQALVADITDERTRGRAYGLLTTSQFGGLIAGPALAWPLYALGGGQGKWAFYMIFLAGTALAASTAVALMLLLREPVRHDASAEYAAPVAREERLPPGSEARPPLRSLITPPVASFLLVALATSFAFGTWEVLWSLYLREIGASMAFVGMTWVAFSIPMLLAFAGGWLADRYSRFALMFSGYAISAVAWIIYGVTDHLTLFLVVNVIEGLAVAWSYPAKQAFLVQVSPRRWLGTIQGMETAAGQMAALAGTLVSPLLFEVVSGYAIGLGGVLALVALAVTAPILARAWRESRSDRTVDDLLGSAKAGEGLSASQGP
jgi:DHA1 family multidrug resistance protein-like MFS transporter